MRKENHFLSSNGFGVAIGMEALLSYNYSSLGLRKGVTGTGKIRSVEQGTQEMVATGLAPGD